MEEVADEIQEKLENEEEVEDIVPEPPPLQRQSNPARSKPVDKVTCEGCGKLWLQARINTAISAKHGHLMKNPKKT